MALRLLDIAKKKKKLFLYSDGSCQSIVDQVRWVGSGCLSPGGHLYGISMDILNVYPAHSTHSIVSSVATILELSSFSSVSTPHTHCRKGGEQRKHQCWGSEWYLGDSARERVQSIQYGNIKIRSEPHLHCLLSNNSGQFIQLLPGWSFSAANGRCLPCSFLAQRPVGRIR